MHTSNDASGLIFCVRVSGQALQPEVQRPYIILLHDAMQHTLHMTQA